MKPLKKKKKKKHDLGLEMQKKPKFISMKKGRCNELESSRKP